VKALVVSFPESENPDAKMSVLCGHFEDDATQHDAVQRLAEWSRTSYAGTENRTHLSGTGPICIAFEQVDVPDFDEREATVEDATGISRAFLEGRGFEPEVTRPDIGTDGWLVHVQIDDPRLDQFEWFSVGNYTVITGCKGGA
jgi:hypothetical protein